MMATVVVRIKVRFRVRVMVQAGVSFMNITARHFLPQNAIPLFHIAYPKNIHNGYKQNRPAQSVSLDYSQDDENQ